MLQPNEVLDFWFGTFDADGNASDEKRKTWFSKAPAFDQEIRDRFCDGINALARGELDSWLEEPRSSLAYIILIDQFCRNAYRDKPEMYQHDALALKATLDGIAKGHDKKLNFTERQFFLLPLMHAEDKKVQEVSIEKYTELRKDGEKVGRKDVGGLEYAIKHKVIVDRFGRYPHRNEILGRESTPEEIEFLKEPGSSF